MRTARWVAAVVLPVMLSACGDDGPEAKREESAVPSAAANPARTTTTVLTVREQTVQVSKVFWHAGFKVTVKSAALGNGRSQYGGPAAPVVSIVANFENVGTDRERFDSETVLQSAGRNHFKPGDGQDLPEVPGGANQDGTMVIVVDPTFRFDDAMLVVGKVDTNQSKVPLGKAGALVAFEPRPVPLTGKLSTVSFNIDLRGGELRADDPVQHRQVPAGRLALKVNYTAALSGCQFINYKLSLVLPDGTTSANVDSGDFGKTDNFATFLVSDRPAGAYTLKLEGEAKGSTGPRCPATFSAQTGFTIA
ncbi:MAG: hypothetical protein M3450_04140 [Actinomycetota bacterium]|nr:hypothetical protein [Actinomycetota bacterium]